jgi:serine protease Do
MDDLQTRLQYYPQGATVQITVMRQNGAEYVEQTFDVTLGGKAGTTGSADSNAGEDNSDHYDGQQQPGMAEDRNNGNGRGH